MDSRTDCYLANIVDLFYLLPDCCVHKFYLERFWGVGVRLQTTKETSQMGTNNNQIPNPKESYFDSPSTAAG